MASLNSAARHLVTFSIEYFVNGISFVGIKLIFPDILGLFGCVQLSALAQLLSLSTLNQKVYKHVVLDLWQHSDLLRNSEALLK